MFLDPNGLEVLPPARCRELIETHQVGRLGFVDGEDVTVLPVSYAVVDDHIVIRTADGSKMAAASVQRSVALEVDDIDERRRTGWSVIARGHLHVVEDEEEATRLEATGLRSWGQTGNHFVRRPLEDLSGRAMRSGPRSAQRG
jgi:nitroimidazol reductase NimA-like FMN-containing flavoprotein (pyridoxamine 5'-phosphate oxidase superfamily)